MTPRLRGEEPGRFDRLREAFFGVGVVVLVAGAVSGIAVGMVSLLHAARDREPRAAPAPIALRPAPAAPLERPVPAPAAPAPLPPGAAAPAAIPPEEAAIPSIDGEGFIRHWLILGPFPFEKSQPGRVELARKQIREEGRPRPQAGLKVPSGGVTLAWFAHAAPDFYIDFRNLLGKIRGEEAVAYAACYLLADEEIKGVRLRMGSNDQAKVLLNGREILEFSETRALQKDQNVSDEVKLHKGSNLLLFKVVNEKQDWQGCLRMTDRAGAPLKGIRLALDPP